MSSIDTSSPRSANRVRAASSKRVRLRSASARSGRTWMDMRHRIVKKWRACSACATLKRSPPLQFSSPGVSPLMSDAPSSPSPAREPVMDRALMLVAGVVVLGVIMSILDVTVVNVALRTLAEDFHTSLTTVQWVATGYTLALATVIPLTGWAADRFGTKRLY